MFSSTFKAWSKHLVQKLVVPTFGRLGVTPNMLTLIGLLLTAGVAMVLADGRLVLGGWLMIAAGMFDLFDGALARGTNQQSSFGAFLDSTVDRYSEAAVLLGLLVYVQTSLPPEEGLRLSVLLYVSIVGSLLVSYTRARAEGLGFKCEVGLLGRPERIAVLCLGLILNWLEPALWILAVFSNVTTLQRMLYIRRQEQAASRKLEPKVTAPARKRPSWLAWFEE